jgi:hypothetical protein
MTTDRKRRRHPAAAARVLATGLSVSSALTITGALAFAGAPTASQTGATVHQSPEATTTTATATSEHTPAGDQAQPAPTPSVAPTTAAPVASSHTS